MTQADTYIIKCPGCGAANRIPAKRMGMTAKCGKCHEELKTDEQGNQDGNQDGFDILPPMTS